MGMYPGGNIIKVSPTVDTSAYGAADLVFDKQEIKNAVPSRGGSSILVSMSLYAGTTTDTNLGILFFDNDTSIGAAANEAITNVSDAEFQAAGFIGAVELDGAESTISVGNGLVYFPGTNNSSNAGFPALLKAADGKTSIWFIAVTKGGTPTYAANGLDFTFNVQYLG